MSDLRFDGRVAIVTGAGNGLGRSHALLLASHGCKVVVNDLGSSTTGGGKSSAAADQVVADIKAAGGEAIANYDSVEDGAKIVQQALDTWKRIDIVINNAGILRDTSFQKMTQEDWDLIYRVHVLGSFRVTKAAWDHMRDAGYGRILFTASAAGIYGNFGQANYSFAKLGLLGFSNTLAIEGKKKNVHSNTIAPIAGSRMTETVMPKEIVDALKPEYVSPLVAWLCHERCEETGGLFEVGGGLFTKLRWERTEGKIFKLGRPIPPEQIEKAWNTITDFSAATHPTDVAASMQPILGNLQSKSLGGNELIDLDVALGHEFPPQYSSYDEKDLAIYALGVGAGADPSDAGELQYVYENAADGFHALPTFGVAPALKLIFEMAKRGETAPGMNYGIERVLHGEQYTELTRPLPLSAKLTHKAKIKNIYDKGRNAIVITEIQSFDEANNLLVTNEISTFVRGAGGWGGERGPASDINVPPNRAPDATVTEKIGNNQAILYRLSGDINPLHVDSNFANAFGFEKPILHGLCTFGYAARHVIKHYSKNDPRYFKSIKVRFSESVFPGETLVTEMWKESDTRIIFRCKVKERDKVVISNAAIELYSEIPKPAAKKAAPAPTAAAAAPAPAAGPTPAAAAGSEDEASTSEAFAVIRDHVERNPDLAKQIGKTYLFRLSEPSSAWLIDLKNGGGAVTEATGSEKADCTLDLTDANFRDMTSGKADPQKLYFGGKMKIAGDLMASQKLLFLQKIDRARAVEVVLKLRGASGASKPAAAAASSAGGAAGSEDEASTSEAFAVIRDHIERNPDLAKQIGKTYLFRLSEPSSAWMIDLKNGGGAVTEATGSEKADCTLDLTDANFRDMTAGKADAQKLYFSGKMKIAGDLMASQKLLFLQKIDRARGVEVVLKLRGASGASASKPTPASAPAQTSAPKEPKAKAIAKALGERIAKEPSLIKEIGAVIALIVTSPDSRFLVDLKNGSGSVKEGTGAADITLKLSDDDLEALAKGESLRDLYQRGRIRIDGDAKFARKLNFFKGLI
ncbi:MAG: SDR family NAD(P)-dependent oxidoreductase [Polyangiaceae bacterium]|nr:SDR family NAD(P)-dependent oxidoreductase [Polyangiaceae bacterium]